MEDIKKKEKSYWCENSECAMIETRRGVARRLFTDKANLPFLVEFARAYKADLAVVKIKAADVWPLGLLAEKLNQAEYTQDVEFEALKSFKTAPEQIVLGPPEAKVAPAEREKVLEEIRQMFLAGDVISLAALAEKYPNINRSTLRHYLTRTRTALFFDGYEIEEVGRGKYATHEKVNELLEKIDRAAAAIKKVETSVTVKS